MIVVWEQHRWWRWCTEWWQKYRWLCTRLHPVEVQRWRYLQGSQSNMPHLGIPYEQSACLKPNRCIFLWISEWNDCAISDKTQYTTKVSETTHREEWLQARRKMKDSRGSKHEGKWRKGETASTKEYEGKQRQQEKWRKGTARRKIKGRNNRKQERKDSKQEGKEGQNNINEGKMKGQTSSTKILRKIGAAEERKEIGSDTIWRPNPHSTVHITAGKATLWGLVFWSLCTCLCVKQQRTDQTWIGHLAAPTTSRRWTVTSWQVNAE